MNSHNLDDVATHSISGLPADEAASFELELDDYLSDELASFRRVAIALTDGFPGIVPAVAPDVWDRISEETGITAPSTPPANHRIARRLMLAAAALIAVVAVGATSLLVSRDSLDTRSMAAAAAADSASFSAVLANPDGVSGIKPEVIIAADGTGYIVADSLPRLSESRTYQLWLIVNDQVVSAALLGNDPGVIQFRAEGEIAGIAISNEAAGGVAVSEVTPTALWLSDSI